MVSRELILSCDAVVSELESQFKARNKYKHRRVDEKDEYKFVRLSSNMSQVLLNRDP